MVSAEEKNV